MIGSIVGYGPAQTLASTQPGDPLRISSEGPHVSASGAKRRTFAPVFGWNPAGVISKGSTCSPSAIPGVPLEHEAEEVVQHRFAELERVKRTR